MSAITKLPGIRVRPDNANHHLWNNHGTWFLHYTVHPTAFTKERIRRSLGTKDLKVARERRDTFFAQLASEARQGRRAARKATRRMNAPSSVLRFRHRRQRCLHRPPAPGRSPIVFLNDETVPDRPYCAA
jgi:hypothetical protein